MTGMSCEDFDELLEDLTFLFCQPLCVFSTCSSNAFLSSKVSTRVEKCVKSSESVYIFAKLNFLSLTNFASKMCTDTDQFFTHFSTTEILFTDPRKNQSLNHLKKPALTQETTKISNFQKKIGQKRERPKKPFQRIPGN